MRSSILLAVPVFIALLLVGSAQANLSLTIPNQNQGNGPVSYGGSYWAYPALFGVEVTAVNPSIYSCTAGANTGYEWNVSWGGGVSNIGIWTAGFQEANGGYEYVGSGTRCNVGLTTVPSQDGYPQVEISTDGNPDISTYHTYSSTGAYTILVQTGNSHVGYNASASASIYLYNEPTTSFSASATSFDVGSTSTLTGTVNCGSSTDCADVSIQSGLVDFGKVASPYSLNYGYTPGSSGTPSLQLCGYDPIQGSNECSGSRSFQVYTDLQNPTISYTSNQLTLLSYSYTIKMPVQTDGSTNEGNPSGTINFGDGTGAQSLSFSTVSGNYVATISHTYSTSGSYSISVSADSYNYNNVGSSYGSTSSNTGSISVATYVPPGFNSITPGNVLETQSYTYNVIISQGNYSIKNVTINWEDGSPNTIITSNSLHDTTTHTYAYSSSPLNPSYAVNVIVCDTNAVCITGGNTISTFYIPAKINSIVPSNTYSTLPTSYTFNIIQGNFSVSDIDVNWGDGSSPSVVGVNTLTPVISHTYATAGTYTIQATPIDINSVGANTFSISELVNQYVLPRISTLTPTSVLAGNTITFKYTATQGTFPFASQNAVVINFGTGTWRSYGNVIVSGTNNALFEYLANGNFTVTETITDSKGDSSTNTTLIQVTQYPWNFTSPTQLISYNVTNSSNTAQFVQTHQNDILNVSYTVQQDNVVNDYVCATATSNNGLFSARCTTNPDSISYVMQTLYATIYAKDTDGVVKTLTMQINLIPHSTPPPQVTTPALTTNSVSPPLQTNGFQPIDPYLVIGLLVVLLIASCVFWMYYNNSQLKGKR